MYPGIYFCLPWGRPCGNHAKRCMNEKAIQCLPNPSQHVPIYLQHFPIYSNRKCVHKWKDNSMLAKRLAAYSFRVIRCLSECVSPKIDIKLPNCISPWDAPGTITLNVVWMEREFDAYKLSI